MDLDLIETIANVVTYAVCPVLILVDLSFTVLDFKGVFEFCEKWWKKLDSIPLTKVIAWLPTGVTRVFSIMYGERHLSIKCFIRSVISSLVAMLLVFLVSNGIDLSGLGANNALQHLVNAFTILGSRLSTSPWLIFAIVICSHLLIDYISLLETRFILSLVGKGGVVRTLILTILDYLASTLIWVGGFYSLVLLGNSIGGQGSVPFAKIQHWSNVVFFPFSIAYERFSEGSIASNKGVPVGHIYGLLTYSTYFTSLVFYFFAISSISLRSVKGLRDRVVGLLRNYTQKRDPKPLTVLALFLGALSLGGVKVLKLMVKLGWIQTKQI